MISQRTSNLLLADRILNINNIPLYKRDANKKLSSLLYTVIGLVKNSVLLFFVSARSLMRPETKKYYRRCRMTNRDLTNVLRTASIYYESPGIDTIGGFWWTFRGIDGKWIKFDSTQHNLFMFQKDCLIDLLETIISYNEQHKAVQSEVA